ncbi:MAG TPA: Gfo/Idh/MocA family oxidoreductase [Chlamydiales bacterium]|nr:Gfo/Idh/MocA family oxidoreductase [Chlamydiales bacterium]
MKSVFAVVGGGRWGRVILSVLAGMKIPFDRIVCVSQFNAQILIENAEKFKGSCAFSVVSSLDELFRNYDVKAAVVVNKAEQHYKTALHLIERHVPILVEKPVVLLVEEARILVQKASRMGICLVPGLSYRFCSYLHAFAKKIAQQGKKPRNFLIDWADPKGELRYGEAKQYDPKIDVAQDVMPHIWSIFSTLFDSAPIRIDNCLKTVGADAATFCVCVEGRAEGTVVLERNATARSRKVILEYEEEILSLDFAKEPGIIKMGKETEVGDSNWSSNPGPLRKQLEYFLSLLDREVIIQNDLKACEDSVIFSEKASSLLMAFKA